MNANAKQAPFSDKSDSSGRSVNALDVQIGRRIRARRIELGISQERLAGDLCLTFQQVQKYERGLNRVSASRLFELCHLLQVSPDFFFNDFEPEASPGISKPVQSMGEQTDAAIDNFPQQEILDLVAAYRGIDNRKMRRQILEMVKTLQASSHMKITA